MFRAMILVGDARHVFFVFVTVRGYSRPAVYGAYRGAPQPFSKTEAGQR
jgi:hypothetical protein